MKKLPLGIQNFKELRENDYLYVDKTEDINNLLTKGKYYIFTRPRHFGKTLLLNTIKELYAGNKSLFKGLWIEDKWNWEERYEVIYIDVGNIGCESQGMKKALLGELNRIAQQHDIQLKDVGIVSMFRRLIEKMHEKYGDIVVLIDAYDQPILDCLEKDQLSKAIEYHETLMDFYSILKPAGQYLEFLLITGVFRFSTAGIFSALNNLTDISNHWRYASLLGFTQKELDHYFKPYKALACEKNHLDEEELVKELKNWYNGYDWDKRVSVYNPYSIMRFFESNEFLNYWLSTETSTFLIKSIQKRCDEDLEEMDVGSPVFEGHIVENIPLATLLFRMGYLTIKERHDRFNGYTLGCPNKEAKMGLRHFCK